MFQHQKKLLNSCSVPQRCIGQCSFVFRNVMLQCLFIAQKSTMFNFFFTFLCEQNIRSKYTEFSGALFRFYGLRNSQKYMYSSLHSCTSLVDQLPPLLVDGMQTMSEQQEEKGFFIFKAKNRLVMSCVLVHAFFFFCDKQLPQWSGAVLIHSSSGKFFPTDKIGASLGWL